MSEEAEQLSYVNVATLVDAADLKYLAPRLAKIDKISSHSR